MDAIKSNHCWVTANFKESVNLVSRKIIPRDLGKTLIENAAKVVQDCSSFLKS